MANEKRLIWDVDMKSAFRAWFDNEDYRTMNEVIDDVPTVDAVEVVHGRWHKPTPCSQEFCTNCGLTPKTNFGWLPPYCPNCGAKMDRDSE